jgi:cellulose synthase/poly-beta-1,6-N-acetylglucosamine synthase-like glycosyltransferase
MDNIASDKIREGSTSLPPVSIIIISKNNHVMLEKSIVSISAVDYPRSKMQVVVLEETDAPRPFDSWIDYRTIPVLHRGFGFARNQALLFARYAIIIFTDDDCTFAPQWICELVQPLMESEATAAVSGVIQVPSCGPIGQCENIIGFPGGGMYYFHLSGGKQIRRATFSTCNCAIRRSAIDLAGGFNESMKFGGEDENISRLISRNNPVIYQPTAIVYHQPRDSVRGVFTWFVRRGYAEAYQACIDRQTFQSIHLFLKNAAAIRFAALSVVCAFSGLGMFLFLPALLLYYCSLLLKFRWARLYYPSLKTFLLVPIVRTVMDVGRDWGIVKGLLTVRTRDLRPEARTGERPRP